MSDFSKQKNVSGTILEKVMLPVVAAGESMNRVVGNIAVSLGVVVVVFGEITNNRPFLAVVR